MDQTDLDGFGASESSASAGDGESPATPEESSEGPQNPWENGPDGWSADADDATHDVVATTYDVTLHEPLFYASRGGAVIETDPTQPATAVMHALGYEYRGLGKRFVMTDDQATDPSYDRLADLPLFVSEMEPVAVDEGERTFRTVSYGTERTIVSDNNEVGKLLVGSKKPFPRSIDGSNSGWHRVREYRGLVPGSTFRLTVWTPAERQLPDELRFRLGIKQTGAVTATARDTTAETVALNDFVLRSVYDIDTELVTELTRRGRFERGTDPRTTRFRNLDTEWVTEEILPAVIGRDS